MKMNRFSNRALAILTALLLLFQQIPALAAAEEWNSATSDPIGTEDYVSVRFTADGEEVAALLVQTGAAIGSLPDAPEREGYAFRGWFAGEEPVTEETVVTGAMEVTASYSNEAYPALLADYDNGKIAVHVSAPEGALPKGVTPRLETVSDDTVRGIVEDAMGHEVGQIAAVNISFLDEYENKIQPEKPVKVQIALTGMQADNVSVVHIPDELLPSPAKRTMLKSAKRGPAPTAEVVDFSVQGDTLSFDADSFSVYAVVEDVEPESRMTIRFWGQDTNTPIATVYVKNSDKEEQISKIIFDPSLGELPDQETFRGWLVGERNEGKPTYTVENATNGSLKTVEQIRSWAVSLEDIEEGDEIDIVAAIYKIYVVTYLNPEGVAQNADSILVMPNHTGPVDYTVSQSYTPVKDTLRFDGWLELLEEEAPSTIVSHQRKNEQTGEYEPTTDPLYQKDDKLQITGNVDFEAKQTQGHYVVFHENGKGATYVAPDFIVSGHSTVEPAIEMLRNGYEFEGWYKGVTGEPDEHGHQQVTGEKYTFNENLDEFGDGKLHLYANWTPRTEAPYTVICWVQNANRDGYDLKHSYVGTGTVYQPIPFTFVNNGDEDYVTGVGSTTITENNTTVTVPHGHYTGFTLKHSSEDQLGNLLDDKDETITVPNVAPEGDSVLNLYFDRIEYNLKFYMYRSTTENRPQNRTYTYATGSNAGQNVWGIAQWTNRDVGINNVPYTTYGSSSGQAITLQQETVGNYIAYYFVLHAYYGEDISSKWPTYEQLKGPNNDGTKAVSFIMMNGTRLKGNGINDNGYGTGKDTIKGQITIMDDGILALTNNANGNYLIIRYYSYNNWTYHIYYECIPGVQYPNPVTKTINGVTKQFYLDHDVTSRSSNTNAYDQNPPAYLGFRVITTDGINEYYDGYGGSGGNYYLNYYYERLTNQISYMDGTYFDGNGNILQSKGGNMLVQNADLGEGMTITQGESNLIPQSAVIADKYKNWEPSLPNGESGYVFAGWYADSACTTPMKNQEAGTDRWGSMPVGGITVHAKWQQVEYRVFLKPNLPEGVVDDEEAWGSSQALTFRRPYNTTVSLPKGATLEKYEFDGWYTTPNFVPSSMFTEDYRLNESLAALQDYNKTTDKTDPLDIRTGEPGANAYNSDLWDPVEEKPRDRWWITKKLVLYAKWREVLPGAPGITVIYDAGDLGNTPPTDSTYYADRSKATAQGGAKPNDTEAYAFECWVVQKWNSTTGKYEDTNIKVYAGDTFDVLKANAREEDIPVAQQTNGITKKYTVQLRAEYEPLSPPKPTHIWWFPNIPGSATADNLPVKVNQVVTSYPPAVTTDDTQMAINQAVMIKPGNTFPAPTGYTFLGWAKVEQADSHSAINDNNAGNVLNLGFDDLYLQYHAATGSASEYYTLKDSGSGYNGNTVDRVAADEVTPYHDLYAVWEKNIDLTVEKIWDPENDYTDLRPTTFTVSLYNSETQSEDTLVDSVTFTSTDSYAAKQFTNLSTRDNNGNLLHYTVAETGADGWTASYDYQNGTYSYADMNSADKNIKITNTLDLGNLKVTKTVQFKPAENAPDITEKTYEFIVKNSKNQYIGSASSPYTFVAESAAHTFTVAARETGVTLSNLPTDTYTVIEKTESAQIAKYVLVVDGDGASTTSASAKVEKDKTATAELINVYEPQPDAPVTLKKVVNGNMANVNQEFSFTVKLTKSDGTTADEIEGITDNQGYVINPATRNTTFTLKHTDASATTLGEFPIGDKLVITETTGTGAELYKTAYTTTGTAPTFPIETDRKSVTVEVTELEAGKTAIEVICGNYWNIPIETGVNTDSAPYVLAASAAMMSAAVWMLLRRRAKAAGRED